MTASGFMGLLCGCSLRTNSCVVFYWVGELIRGLLVV